MRLNEMEKKLLSKHRYVYCIYVAQNCVHVEKFPVVYINSENLYFKQAGSKELTKVGMFYVNPRLTEKTRNAIEDAAVGRSSREYRVYVLEMTEEEREQMKDLEPRLAEIRKRLRIKKLEENVEKAKHQLEWAEAAYTEALAKKREAEHDLP